ncbi:hypothetical protein LTR37_013941 [Vermiconidia calcicola]|uniref:Uncharacterized protein n=1 Tax=Vermiconidia calcicola TaxID=1690605 RepID=A0ACC3MWF1_9PEZI|nr:hypothetical protein LTR37_013941 [Vermiconidia calcicola]
MRIMELYPDVPELGVPRSIRRVAAIVGDVFYHATRLNDARHHSLYSPTYIYRFNTRPYDSETGNNLAPLYKGVEHFAEVAFVFNNPENVGPWPSYKALGDQMSEQLIHFANSGDPNGENVPRWPLYNESEAGLNLVLQTSGQGGSYVENDTYRLGGREYLRKWARRRHV